MENLTGIPLDIPAANNNDDEPNANSNPQSAFFCNKYPAVPNNPENTIPAANDGIDFFLLLN